MSNSVIVGSTAARITRCTRSCVYRRNLDGRGWGQMCFQYFIYV